jgi:hypothetical protein
MNKRGCAFVATLVLALGMSSAPAWSDWRSPQTVASGLPLDPELATDREGRGIVVYIDLDPQEELWARRITARGALRAPVKVSPPDSTLEFYDVALDDDGDAVVAWGENTFPGPRQIFARRLSRTGALGPIVRVSDPAEISWSPEVAISPRGVATIVYEEPRQTQDDVSNTIAVRLGRDNDLGPRTILPDDQYPSHPVVSRSGHVAFALSNDDIEAPARAVRIDPDGDVHMRSLTPDLPGRDGMADVAVDRRGNVYVAVTKADGSRAWVRTWRRDGSLGTPRRLSPRGEQAPFVLIRSDLAGDSVVLWARYDQYESVLKVSGRTWRQGSLGRIARLGKMTGYEMHTVPRPSWNASVDDDGDGVLAWHVMDYTRRKEVLRVVHVTRRGDITPVRELGHGTYPRVASTPEGRHLLAHMWYGGTGYDEKILLRIDD